MEKPSQAGHNPQIFYFQAANLLLAGIPEATIEAEGIHFRS